MANAIDDVNQRTMRSASAVKHYCHREGLTPAERASLDAVAGAARGPPLLDLGVGGGRTVRALRAISADYLGIDNRPESTKTGF
jgi:tRNA G46 methylase TrmB